MVATFASYATIEEAWGSPVPPPSKEKRKKRDRAFDDIFESFAGDMLPPPAPVNSNAKEAAPCVSGVGADDMDFELVGSSSMPSAHLESAQPVHPAQQPYAHPPCQHGFEEASERQYLNFAMYVFSGVCLIFVMEQFVQIGMAMRGSR